MNPTTAGIYWFIIKKVPKPYFISASLILLLSKDTFSKIIYKCVLKFPERKVYGSPINKFCEKISAFNLIKCALIVVIQLIKRIGKDSCSCYYFLSLGKQVWRIPTQQFHPISSLMVGFSSHELVSFELHL